MTGDRPIASIPLPAIRGAIGPYTGSSTPVRSLVHRRPRHSFCVA
ncbi:hypothetical protein [Oxynema sp. CENA135]|nr:hypothetical protein [Oxynema sp. CENA135]